MDHRRRQPRRVVARGEQHRHLPRLQQGRDGLGTIPGQVDVEDGGIEPGFGSDHLQRMLHCGRRTDHHRAHARQLLAQQFGEQGFVLHHQDAALGEG